MEVKLGEIVAGTGKPEAQKEMDNESNLQGSKSEVFIVYVVTICCGDAHRSSCHSPALWFISTAVGPGHPVTFLWEGGRKPHICGVAGRVGSFPSNTPGALW